MNSWSNSTIRDETGLEVDVFEVDNGSFGEEIGYHASWNHDTSYDQAVEVFATASPSDGLKSGRRLTYRDVMGLKIPWWPRSSLAASEREQEPFYDVAWFPEKEPGSADTHLSFKQRPFIQEYPFAQMRMNVYGDGTEPLETFYPSTADISLETAEQDVREVERMIQKLKK